MNPVIIGCIVLGVPALLFVLHKVGLVDFSDKTAKRGSGSVGSGFLGAAFDEVFHPVRHEAQLEQQRQNTLPAPAPEADGDPLGVGGPSGSRRVIIELDQWGHPIDPVGASRVTARRD
ncbi:hypothetical protein [Gryllotalpicola ginsengisoli]|uniref:hypothetical protein n=1 Tax=Gryllotalpicola ginsengisoli TaxID=444608 RepID=UPI0003B36FCB|nr:hypothetical protein [Gryllotalpicola ginsengisoli]